MSISGNDYCLVYEGRIVMFGLRWKISLLIWWLWIKVTPGCTGKQDILDAVAKATIRTPTPEGDL
jgi:hypothetical protein